MGALQGRSVWANTLCVLKKRQIQKMNSLNMDFLFMIKLICLVMIWLGAVNCGMASNPLCYHMTKMGVVEHSMMDDMLKQMN